VHPDPRLLLEQASDLIADNHDETALRSAVNRAYYAVFHCVLRYIANRIAGDGNRGTNLYRSVYRSVAHKRIRTTCKQLGGTKIEQLAPVGGFGKIIEFAQLFLNLQDQREYADYDPVRPFEKLAEVTQMISTARTAIHYLQGATEEQRGAFLALVLASSMEKRPLATE
jgi:hypothetical protein